MILGVDILTVVFGIAGFAAGLIIADSKKTPVKTDQDLARDLEYHRNLTDSLKQDVAELKRRNNELLEKNWQLTKNK